MNWLTILILVGMAAIVILPRTGLGPLKSAGSALGGLLPNSTPKKCRKSSLESAVVVYDALVKAGATKEAADFAKLTVPLLFAQEGGK